MFVYGFHHHFWTDFNPKATTDIPCAIFASELMVAYPDAKIILNTRDVEGWAKSVDGSFYAILSWKRWRLLEFIDPV